MEWGSQSHVKWGEQVIGGHSVSGYLFREVVRGQRMLVGGERGWGENWFKVGGLSMYTRLWGGEAEESAEKNS